jgi:hypothetical protein
MWLVPPGGLTDFSTTVKAGESLPLGWAGLPSGQYVDHVPSNNTDIWVTAFEYTTDPWAMLILSEYNFIKPVVLCLGCSTAITYTR